MRSCPIHVHKHSLEAMLLQQCREITTVILSITPWLPTYMGLSLIRCNKKAPSGKKPKKDATPVTGTGSPRFTKEQEEEALAGIPQNLREARRKKGLCDCCGLPKHCWQCSRRDISISSTRKTEKKGKGKKKKDKDDSEAAPAATASSVALKRKAPTNTVSIGVVPLPPCKRILAP